MGQKVNPIGLRLGINKEWNSTWFAKKQDFAPNLIEDQKVKKMLRQKYSNCAIANITIERMEGKLVVNIFTAKPGMIIGAKGAGIETIKKDVTKVIRPIKNLIINVKEVKKPDLSANLIAESIASQLEKRVQWRRALKMALQKVMRAGAKGCKVQVSGVIDGASTIARTENYLEGNLPLHTLRADIDYGTSSAYTDYGKLGVKCWIYKGDILPVKATEKGGQE